MITPAREGETIEGSRTMRNRPYPVLKCSSFSIFASKAPAAAARCCQTQRPAAINGHLQVGKRAMFRSLSLVLSLSGVRGFASATKDTTGCDASDPECAFFLQTVACIKDPASCNGPSLDGTEKPASHQSRSTGGDVPGTRFVEGTVAGYLSALAYDLPGEFSETAAVHPTSSWEATCATLRDSQKPHLKASVNVCNNVQSAVKNVQYMQTPGSWAWSSGTWFAATGFTATVDAGALPGFPQTTKIVSFTGSEDLGDFLVDASAGFAETITLGGKEYAGNNGFTDEYKSLRAEWLTSSFCDGAPRVLVTGHSLGGAMANYGAVELRNMGCKVDLVTLGAPRAFDDDGWKWRYYRWVYYGLGTDDVLKMVGDDFTTTRWVNEGDGVPSCPPSTTGSKHLSSPAGGGGGAILIGHWWLGYSQREVVHVHEDYSAYSFSLASINYHKKISYLTRLAEGLDNTNFATLGGGRVR